MDAIEAYGGITTPCAPTMESREAVCAEVMAKTGTTFIPPYNYGPTICGQGTIALEFLKQASTLLECADHALDSQTAPYAHHAHQFASVCAWFLNLKTRYIYGKWSDNECLCCSVQVPDLDMLIVPISGGGMISGIAVAAKALKPGIAVIGAEPTGGRLSWHSSSHCTHAY